MRQSSLGKLAIAVTGPADAGTDFVAGMPAGSPASRETVFPMLRRFQRAVASKQEAGMSDALSEGMSEVAGQLHRKFGAFTRGFLDELMSPRTRVARNVVNARRPSVPARSGIVMEKLESPAAAR